MCLVVGGWAACWGSSGGWQPCLPALSARAVVAVRLVCRQHKVICFLGVQGKVRDVKYDFASCRLAALSTEPQVGGAVELRCKWHSTCLYACRMRVPRSAASSCWMRQATRRSSLCLSAQLPFLPANHHSLAGLRQVAGCGPRPAHCAHPQPAAHQGGCWAATDCLHEAVVSPHVLLAHGLESRLAAALPGSMPCTRPGKAGQSGQMNRRAGQMAANR